MVDRLKFVAVLTQSPALGSIISMVLDCEESLNVQTFNRVQSLERHARIAPLDLIICDAKVGADYAPQLAIDLRQALPNRRIQFIILAEHTDHQFKQACMFANIDEVIAKPMSPLFLRDRTMAQLSAIGGKSDVALNRSNFETNKTPIPTGANNVVHIYRSSEKNHPLY